MIKKVISILAVIIILMGIWRLYRVSYAQALTHTILVAHCDNTINPALQDEIEAWCTRRCSLRNTRTWIKEFKETFPIIDRIHSRKETENSLVVTITGKKIKARLNESFILDKDGAIFPCTYINEKECILPSINTKADIEYDPEFKTFIQHAPSYILENYSITWQSPHEIYLKPKTGPSIVIRHNLIPTPTQLKQGELLCSQRAKKRNMNCIIDARFNDQIVIYDTRGR